MESWLSKDFLVKGEGGILVSYAKMLCHSKQIHEKVTNKFS